MSIIINGTAESIRVVLDAAPATNQCPATVNYGLVGGSLGDATVLTTGSTAVTLLAGSATAPIVVNSIQFLNIDTAQRTLSVTKVTGAGTFLLARVTLAASVSLYYDSANGWYCVDSFGNLLTSSGLPAGVTLNQPNIVGITNGSNAAAGSVGEVIMAVSGSTALTNNTFTNLTSITLTPGDWTVEGSATLSGSVANMTNVFGGINNVSMTAPAAPYYFQYSGAAISAFSTSSPAQRFNVTSNTTIYIIGFAGFASGTVSAFGGLMARRMR